MILHGDSLERLKELDDCSIDAVVTDPPYGLGNTSPRNVAECLRAWSCGETWEPSGRGFMGKSWDAWVPPPELWREVFRVMKHGAHGIVFAGSRTQDLMSISLRLAGFEVRDTLQWIYGSGFPKSHNVSKGIDKWGGAPHLILEVARALKTARESRGVTVTDADRLFCDGTTMYSWFEGRPRGHLIPNDETFARIVDAWPELAPLADKLREAEREVIGGGKSGIGGKGGVSVGGESTTFDITASATDEARKWEGWGTALKPAYEPAILIRKPLAGTVARNVLEHGTGALNIDATRVHAKGEVYGRGGTRPQIHGYHGISKGPQIPVQPQSPLGRWPANILLDEVSAQALDDQVGGNVSRFFYCSKVGRKERGDNHHPTVKPLDLMRYLVRLITPPDGVVLDPFAGSGSTLCAGVLEGFRVIGIEREAEYVEIARARLAHWSAESAESAESETGQLAFDFKG